MSKALRSHLKNFILMAVCATVCVLIAYGVLKFAGHSFHVPKKTTPHVICSSLNIQIDENRATRYFENKRVREIAVYDGRIEYDIHYRTNNLGLIDDKDYADDIHEENASNHYVFVGDSFTAGVGTSAPWVPLLRDKLAAKDPSFQIYNLGVTGTGCIQFERLLRSFSSHFQFKKIFILAISDDLTRPPWRPLKTGDEIRVCKERESDDSCLKRIPVATIMKGDTSTEEALSHAARLEQKYPSTRLPLFIAINHLLKHPLIRLLNIKALWDIRRGFPESEIVFIHLPEKKEVEAGKYRKNLKNIIEILGFRYFPALNECSWQPDMFHPHDSHPNDRGYKNLSACLEKSFFDSL